jgi:hypothetical protein
MLEEMNKSIISRGADIKHLQQQTTNIDKVSTKFADNQATLVGMTDGKPQTTPIGMNSISIKEELPSSFEDTYNDILNYNDLLEPLVIHLPSLIKRGEEEERLERLEKERLEKVEKEKKEEESR